MMMLHIAEGSHAMGARCAQAAAHALFRHEAPTRRLPRASRHAGPLDVTHAASRPSLASFMLFSGSNAYFELYAFRQ